MIEFLIAILEIIFAIGFVVVWIYLFKVEFKKPDKTEVYLGYEKSFPLADLGWITPTLLISGIGLLMGERFGVFFAIIAGSSLVFLGVLDISFNLQQKGYTKNKSDTIFNLFINLVCVIFGPILMVFGWLNF
ncbi:MAG: hypothetical protein HWN65_02695 [Candidatus Helarchaeota archaeon]|nr:hypothetical protein [Candidatus Helarchaeota archaeon]